MKILFAGGGSLGPVTPLLAVAHAIQKRETKAQFAWAGTPDGPEKSFAKERGMSFYVVPVAKWPRYPSMRWVTFPLDARKATQAAERILDEVRPDAVVSVGGFTAVPIIRAASKRGIPCLIHQLDKVPTLSNRLVARRCVSVTSSFAYERPPFGSGVRVEQIATPTRVLSDKKVSSADARESFGLEKDGSVVLITGGGQGAQALNDAFVQKRDAWLKQTQVIHLCGRGKKRGLVARKGYVVSELLDAEEMQRAYAASDVIVTRAGMGSLSDIAAGSKAAVVVPIPKSHQVENIRAFAAAEAAVFVSQTQPDFADILFQQARDLLEDKKRREAIGRAAHTFLATDDGSALAERVLRAIKKSA